MNGLRIAFSLENLQAFVYAYAGLTWFLKIDKSQSTLKKSTIVFLRIALTIPIVILAYLIILACAIYYEIINLILKLKHGRDYVGILEGTDVIWIIEEKNRSLINSLFVLEVKENETHHDVQKFFTESYEKLCHTHTKLGCVRRRYMGYAYFLKTKIDVTKFVRYMDDYDDEDGFKLVLDKYSNSPLPLNDTALWEIWVGKTALKWKRGDKCLYPVLVKYHHSVGDGITLVAMCTTNLLRDGVDIMKKKCDTYKEMLNKNKKRVKSVVEKVIDVCSKEYYIKYCGLLSDKQFNLLHGKELLGEKHLCWALEDEQGGYVDKVKDIKNRFVGISFSDVILTAISASFAEYYIKHDQHPPQSIRAAMTHFFSSPEFKKIITFKNGHPVVKLNNKFSVGMVDIPIKNSDLGNNLVSRLFEVHKDMNLLKNAVDFPFLYWQLKVVSTVIPMPLLLLSAKTNDNTLAVTNVPGNNTATLLSGHIIRDTIIWAPNYLNIGLSISIFTFDNLFRFGLMVDKALIQDRKAVQSILDNVFKYIDYLDEATKTF